MHWIPLAALLISAGSFFLSAYNWRRQRKLIALQVELIEMQIAEHKKAGQGEEERRRRDELSRMHLEALKLVGHAPVRDAQLVQGSLGPRP